MICTRVVWAVLILILNTSGFAQQLTARQYYNELYSAGGLDHFTDEYVCFRGDDVPTFFLLAKSDAVRELLIDGGEYKKLSEKDRKNLDKGFLMVTMYSKGIPGATEYFTKDSRLNGYSEDVAVGMPPRQFKVVLTVQWQTLRYDRTVEYKGLPKASDTGKCEEVKPGVHQHGGE